MNLEIKALEKNITWKLVPLATRKIPIGRKWVFKIKHKADGTIERYKARVVAKGFNQKEGIDYTKTFAPVAKMVTVRTLLAITISNGWIIEQLDINNAFLHGDLHEDVYMQIPQGNEKRTIQQIKASLNEKFNIKYLGPMYYYLGIDFFRNSKGLAMTQRKYATYLITHAGLLHTKPSSIPLDPILKLTMTGGEPLTNPSLYRTLVGKLIYLTITRHDLAFSVQGLS
ncbi:retrovirus-related pol polyprotein from transposon TNT 1-94 [Tanacetum coccineum]